MDLKFLFARGGVTIKAVAEAAGVDFSTAYRWSTGEREAKWLHVTKLYARGLLTDDDLRAAGLAIPRSAELSPAKAKQG